MVATTSLTAAQILAAGKATFTLEGSAGRWTFRIKRVENSGRPPVYFASLLTGADNENDYTYLGIYDPHTGGIRLTKASKMTEDSLPVRGLRWAAKLAHDAKESEIEAKGYRLMWSCQCQRCGRALTVPSSIDNRLGPECVKHVMG